MDEDELANTVAKAEREHRTALQELLNRSKESATQVIHHLRGQPEKRIPAFIDENGIDILVMGTVARTGIAGFLIGNTAENVIQELSCSLLALKPKGFVSPVKAH